VASNSGRPRSDPPACPQRWVANDGASRRRNAAPAAKPAAPPPTLATQQGVMQAMQKSAMGTSISWLEAAMRDSLMFAKCADTQVSGAPTGGSAPQPSRQMGNTSQMGGTGRGITVGYGSPSSQPSSNFAGRRAAVYRRRKTDSGPGEPWHATIPGANSLRSPQVTSQLAVPPAKRLR
jgi:hypothetical protein